MALKNKDKKEEESGGCSSMHTMYEDTKCIYSEGHAGLHRGIFEGDLLRWGVPSYEEMYDVVKAKN